MFPKCEDWGLDSQNPLSMLGGDSGLPGIPAWEGKDKIPQNKLASQTSHICELWGSLRDPVSMNKVEEQWRTVPDIPAHHAGTWEKKRDAVTQRWYCM